MRRDTLVVGLMALFVATGCSAAAPGEATPSTPAIAATASSVPSQANGTTPSAAPSGRAPARPTPRTRPRPTERPPAGLTPSPPTVPPSPAIGTPLANAVRLDVLARGDRDLEPSATEADVRTLVAANTRFAFDLYARMAAATDGDLVLSPYGITRALAMNLVGARGQTARQMERALHLDIPGDRIDGAMNALDLALDGLNGEGVKVTVADQLFGERTLGFEEPFLRRLSEQYGAPLALVDYKGAPDGARILINSWVEEQTNRLIPDLLAPGRIHEDIRLVLVDTVYLDAAWERPFNAALTAPGVFTLLDGTRLTVETMAQSRSEVPVTVAGDYRAIELPYAGGRLAMLIVVPEHFRSFEAAMDPARLDRIVAKLEDGEVDLRLPRFTSKLPDRAGELKPILEALGMRVPFHPYLADFSGITGEEPLFQEFIVHGAVIKVAEAGTEAAAATAVGDSVSSGPPPRFDVNRPFLWFIRDRETGTVLFMGRVLQPLDPGGVE